MHCKRIAATAAVGCFVISGLAAQSSVAASRQTSTNHRSPAIVAAASLSSSRTLAASMKPYASGNGSRALNAIKRAPAQYQSAVGVVVVSVDWRDIETAKGVYTTTPIDTELKAAADRGLTVRLRVIAGTRAPDYVKRIGGAPIPFYDHQAKESTTIGRFWNGTYQRRWQALMTKLAAAYDTNPLIREVNISGTGTISAETMLTMGNDTLPGSTVTNNDRLIAAGASETARRSALMKDITFMQKTWAHTHTTLFAHPYVTLEPKPSRSLSTTEDIVTAVYAAAPGKTVFGHTGASETTLKGLTHSNVLEMYQFFIDHHYPFMAQTQAYSGGAKNEGVGDLAYVVTWLAQHGAYSTELPAGWQVDPGALEVLAPTTEMMRASCTLS